MQVKLTPTHRFYIAYFTGVAGAALPMMLVTELRSEEPTAISILYIVLFIVNIFIYAWNYNVFNKETLWMTIKNPAKIAIEQDDFNRASMRPIKPPPPPRPPKPPVHTNGSMHTVKPKP